MADSNLKNALPIGTVLHLYTIDSVLGHGGFGIVYKGHHTDLGAVAIKEYLPPDLAVREETEVHPLSDQSKGNYDEGLRRFVEEAKQLIQFNHPNIVRCRDFFRAHGTAYLVMDFEEGLPLSELIRLRESRDNRFSEEEIRGIMEPLMDGLQMVHDHGVLHRDIKPGNVFIRRSTEQPVLIDFGAAKQNFSEHSKSLAPYSPGYAAIEQIEDQGNLGPWTDIYALGAVMWRIVSGDNPPPVEKRTNALIRGNPDPMTPAVELGGGRYSEGFLNTIDRCLRLREEDRFQSIQELKSAFANKSFSSSAAASGSEPAAEAEQPSRPTAPAQAAGQSGPKRSWGKWASAAVVVVGVSIAGPPILENYTGRGDDSDSDQSGQPATEQDQQAGTASTDTGTQADTSVSGTDRQDGPTPAELERQARLERIEEQRQRLESREVQSLAGEMVRISGGEFRMGDVSGVGESDELPVRTVDVEDFYIGRYEVTVEQFLDFVDATGYVTDAESGTDDANCSGDGWRNPGFFQTPGHPAGCLSFNDAMAYIDWLSSETGIGFRLPSEAEWEYAARANNESAWYFGNNGNAICDYGNISGSDVCDDGFVNSAPVGSFEPNDFGLYDMAGNNFEYVADCWNDSYQGAPTDGSPRTADCNGNVIRGGSFSVAGVNARSAARAYHADAEQAHNSDGFRLAVDLAE